MSKPTRATKSKPAQSRAKKSPRKPAKAAPKLVVKRGEADALKPGQKVSWKSTQGVIHGTVKRKLTAPMKIKTHTVSASPEHPEYLVKSAKTGARAAHKPEALKTE